jgi:hypothetical protein
MQAPQRPAPQPNLVPVSWRPSRITHKSGVVGGASLDAAFPFIVKIVAISLPPSAFLAYLPSCRFSRDLMRAEAAFGS